MEPSNSSSREERRSRAVVVGGSIAGITCAHALIRAGWHVTVVEKSLSPPSGSPTGAGLGLDPQSRKILSFFLANSFRVLQDIIFPLNLDLNRVTDSERKIGWTLTRDDEFGFSAAHWADLHSILYEALPDGVVLWGHQHLSLLQDSGDSLKILGIKARDVRSDEVVEIAGDLIVAADGCSSAIRHHFLPDFKLRYSGYSAWRGVLDFSGKEDSEMIVGLRRAYPELGNCLYFDLAQRTHCVLYELRNKRMNWIWYQNMPEPKKKGTSVTTKVSPDMMKKLHNEADKVWVPELASLMKETSEPFINIIYDSDPLPQLFWGNVLLVGDAAHPTTPHGVRSTNMSIVDAAALGSCLEKWGLQHLEIALKEFEAIRLPIITKQVLHARQLGRMKQGLALEGKKFFDPMTATRDECYKLQQRNMPYFVGAPLTI